MDIRLKKTIRPTKLQPQLFRIIKELKEKKDYKVIVNSENNPLCVLVSYELLKDVDLEKHRQPDENELIRQMKDYYADMPPEDAELANAALDDGIL